MRRNGPKEHSQRPREPFDGRTDRPTDRPKAEAKRREDASGTGAVPGEAEVGSKVGLDGQTDMAEARRDGVAKGSNVHQQCGAKEARRQADRQGKAGDDAR